MSQKPTNPKDAMAVAKAPLSLLSPIAKAFWASAQYLGAKKYGSWNWRAAGVLASVYVDAMHRHLDAWVSGEEYDEEGTHNLGAVMACASILLDARAAGKLVDDRPPSVDVRPTYAAVTEAMKKIQTAHADKSPKHYTIADNEYVKPEHLKEIESQREALSELSAAMSRAARSIKKSTATTSLSLCVDEPSLHLHLDET